MAANNDQYVLSSLDKALSLLDLLSHRDGLSLAEVSRASGINKPSCFRMLHTLERRNFVSKSEDGKYSLGIKFLYFGSQTSLHSNLISAATPHMQSLASETGGIASLVVLEQMRAITIHQEEPPTSAGFSIHGAMNVAAQSLTSGRVLMAFLDDEERRAVANAIEFHAYSGMAIHDSGELLARLDQIHERGYDIDSNDRYEGFGAISYPVFDHSGACPCALSVIGTSALIRRLEQEKLDIIGNTALSISTRLGYQG